MRPATLKEKIGTWRTWKQALILGVVGGPTIWLITGFRHDLWWAMLAMFLAGPIVDLIRPTYIR